MHRLDSKTVLVSVANSGIGRAAANLSAREGAAVALLDLPGPELDATATECRKSDRGASPSDATPPPRTRSKPPLTRPQEALGPMDCMFSNAGVPVVAPITDTSDEQWPRQLHVNLSGGFFVQRAAVRRTLPRRTARNSTTSACRCYSQRNRCHGR
jgi:NAD(P)-dependent dehydrogenase (short-subunit alcohol dehydrogenase family)